MRYMEMADRIALRMQELGMAQEDLAAEVGLSQVSIHKILKGGQTRYLAKIAKALQCSVEYLTNGEGEANSNVKFMPYKPRQVPVISWVVAGKWCESPDNFEPGDADEWVISPFECSDRAYCLVVSGKSMEPDYADGSHILVDPAVEAIHNDDIVVRDTDGRQNFKRLQITPEGTYLLALNPEHPERIIKVPPETQICGVVLGVWTKRRRKW